MAVSVDRIGSFAVPRAQLEQNEQRTCFGLDVSVVSKAPVTHLFGFRLDALDMGQIDALRRKSGDRHLDEVNERFGVVIGAEDRDETCVVLLGRPEYANNSVLHGEVLLVRAA